VQAIKLKLRLLHLFNNMPYAKKIFIFSNENAVIYLYSCNSRLYWLCWILMHYKTPNLFCLMPTLNLQSCANYDLVKRNKNLYFASLKPTSWVTNERHWNTESLFGLLCLGVFARTIILIYFLILPESLFSRFIDLVIDPQLR